MDDDNQLVPVDPFHGYLDDMSAVAIRNLPDYFEFEVLERWFSDQTQLSFRQSAEDLMEFCDIARHEGYDVHVWASQGELQRTFRFKRRPKAQKEGRIDEGAIDI
jgi:hypothetical protein